MSVDRTPAQSEIVEKAEELLATLERLVPRTTIHYAVDEAKLSLRTLVRVAHTIKCSEDQSTPGAAANQRGQ